MTLEHCKEFIDNNEEEDKLKILFILIEGWDIEYENFRGLIDYYTPSIDAVALEANKRIVNAQEYIASTDYIQGYKDALGELLEYMEGKQDEERDRTYYEYKKG